ncbi:protein jagged-2-like [Leptopilina heterotoma]|uniref:protein jagged-2-like n=1 Tax=Leptopilina heterotoma TaxID=63436 RepID=UPI001CA9D5B3|nr:protein jagged-2-like [Leptopilina heterotoma]
MKYSVVFLLFVGLCVVATFANEEPSVEDVGTECGENGAPCTKDLDCCKGNRCNDKTQRCERRCRREGDRCERDRNCCEGMKCRNKKCARQDCGRGGAKCENNLNCCQGLVCRNKRCSERM